MYTVLYMCDRLWCMYACALHICVMHVPCIPTNAHLMYHWHARWQKDRYTQYDRTPTPTHVSRYLYWSDNGGVFRVPLTTARSPPSPCVPPATGSYIVPSVSQPLISVSVLVNKLYYTNQSFVYSTPINSTSDQTYTCVGDEGSQILLLTTFGTKVVVYISSPPYFFVDSGASNANFVPLIMQYMHPNLQPLPCKVTAPCHGSWNYVCLLPLSSTSLPISSSPPPPDPSLPLSSSPSLHPPRSSLPSHSIPSAVHQHHCYSLLVSSPVLSHSTVIFMRIR